MRIRKQIRAVHRRGPQRGSMLIELMIAMIVLAIGLSGIFVLLAASMSTNAKAGNDTTSTMLAEHVMEQISSQPANSTALLTITDCAGTAWNLDPTPAAIGAGSGGSYGGNGANLTSNNIVDWTQSYAAVPANYAMQYVACGAGGRQITYDVRWDVITVTAFSRVIVVSARPSGSATVGGLRFVIPVNLRTIGGM